MTDARWPTTNSPAREKQSWGLNPGPCLYLSWVSLFLRRVEKGPELVGPLSCRPLSAVLQTAQKATEEQVSKGGDAGKGKAWCWKAHWQRSGLGAD